MAAAFPLSSGWLVEEEVYNSISQIKSHSLPLHFFFVAKRIYAQENKPLPWKRICPWEAALVGVAITPFSHHYSDGGVQARRSVCF